MPGDVAFGVRGAKDYEPPESDSTDTGFCICGWWILGLWRVDFAPVESGLDRL